MPEHAQLREGVQSLLVGQHQHDVRRRQLAAQHELRIQGFEVQQFEESKVAQQPRACDASSRNGRADGPPPPALPHATLAYYGGPAKTENPSRSVEPLRWLRLCF